MRIAWVVVAVLMTAVAGVGRAADVVVDVAKEAGVIRPLHGINGGPIEGQGLIDLSKFHREMRVPLTRLHDCNWPNPDVVDVHAVFPDFSKDPERAESYDFVRTDAYVASVLGTGSGVVYRLGESIEHGKDKRRVAPPADPEKWARVCLGIVRHYNEGWAGGFRHGIRYWEIWNEPENRPSCWTGTDEEFFRLYVTAARALKREFPQLKVGGPAVGNTGKVEGGRYVPSAFVAAFLERCEKERAPLDFFSWHWYSPRASDYTVMARGVRELLDRRGFRSAESHLNEWNYLPDDDWGPVMLKGQGAARRRFVERLGGAEGAAFAATVLAELQDAPVDVANYFSGNAQGFGMFDPYGAPRKTYFAFKAFAEVQAMPKRVAATGAEKVAVLAGRGEGEVKVLVANRGAEKVRMKVVGWPGKEAAVRVWRVGEKEELALVREGRLEGGVVELVGEGPGVYLVRVGE